MVGRFHIGPGALWAYVANHKIGMHDRITIEEQRVSVCCNNGVMNRLAERMYKPPYSWVPVGYRCSRCGGCYINTSISV